jgi:tetratricopeptide (TPR) repeat protein
VGSLGRSIALLPSDDEAHHELMCELAIAQASTGHADAAAATLSEATASAERAGHVRVELRARIEAAYQRLLTEPEDAALELLVLTERAIPAFEALEDNRSLARAWLLAGYVRGGIHGNHAAWEEAEERALVHYRRSAFPPATCLGQIAAAIYWGPTPVSRGIERCGELLDEAAAGLFGRATVLPYLGGLHAQGGDLSRARELVDEAEGVYGELGATASATITCGTVRADIELLAADLPAAEETLREQCAFLERTHDRSHLAVRAAKLAETLYRQDRLDEAEEWASVSRANAASDDRSVQLVLGPVEAKLLARRGAAAEARERAEGIVRLADTTDGLNQTATARLALAEVLRHAGAGDDARRACEEAVQLFERKGNVLAASQARDGLGFEVPA